MTVSNEDKCKYLQILSESTNKHAKNFTNKDLSELLNVSVRKLIDFKNGKIFDFWLLIQYAALVGIEISFDIK